MCTLGFSHWSSTPRIHHRFWHIRDSLGAQKLSDTLPVTAIRFLGFDTVMNDTEF